MSEVKVNKISPRTNCGTVQLGDSGDTITIPSGATITNSGTAAGFGSTGEVSWNTTKVTTGFTATSGVGYFADTSSAAFTITLPASPSAGNVVAISDYTGTFGTNNITVGRNSSNINGAASDLDLNVSNTTTQLIYVDATEGWRTVFTGALVDVNASFISATGGNTVATCGDYKIHSFTSPGTFTVSSLSNNPAFNVVDYVVVGGGAGGGGDAGGGGGAGGYRESHCSSVSGSYTASPAATTSSLPVSVQAYPITVGGGGAAGTAPSSPGHPGPVTPGGNGNTSTFSTITAAAGGFGGKLVTAGGPGGSGGGVGVDNSSGPGGGSGTPLAGGTGNTPPVSPPQGNDGGDNFTPRCGDANGGGGGGALAAGGDSVAPGQPQFPTSGPTRGNGGTDATTNITGSPVAYAGGGAGGTGGQDPASVGTTTGSPGGTGGTAIPGNDGGDGTTNRGGGGAGGAGGNKGGGQGGSGIVVIRYKFQ